MTGPGNVDVPTGAFPGGDTAKRQRIITVESVLTGIDVFSRRVFDWFLGARIRSAAKRRRGASVESAGRTRRAVKRQRVSVVESALTSIDVVSQLAAFLEANELCQVKATCKVLGSANDEAASNGLSIAEEAARRIYEGASDEEKAMLPRYAGESWIVLYHHLLMLRGKLTFDQLVGPSIEYRGGDKAAVQAKAVNGVTDCNEAICGNHIMRAGKHWATFTRLSSSRFSWGQTVGVIRPLPGWETRGLDYFSPIFCDYHADLLRESTDRWEGDVNCCYINTETGRCYSSDWTGEVLKDDGWEGHDDYDTDCNMLGMLLDLDNGTLSLYQNGLSLGTLRDGLAGEYCWAAGFWGDGDGSIQRSYEVESSTQA